MRRRIKRLQVSTALVVVHVLDTPRKMVQVADLLELANVRLSGMDRQLEQLEWAKGQLIGLESIAHEVRRSNLPCESAPAPGE